MAIALGAVLIKPYKKINNQYIATQFFVFVIPLIPLNSYFVTNGNLDVGFEIGIKWKHVLKYYSVFFTLIITIMMIFPEFIDINNFAKSFVVFLTILLNIYLIFVFDKMDILEKNKRIFFEKTVGVNALPDYMHNQSALMLKNKYIIELKARIGTEKYWNEIVEDELYSEENLPLMYIISEFEFKINPNSKNEKIRDNLMKKVKI
jgi:hypothetical protein